MPVHVPCLNPVRVEGCRSDGNRAPDRLKAVASNSAARARIKPNRSMRFGAAQRIRHATQFDQTRDMARISSSRAKRPDYRAMINGVECGRSQRQCRRNDAFHRHQRSEIGWWSRATRSIESVCRSTGASWPMRKIGLFWSGVRRDRGRSRMVRWATKLSSR